MAARSQGLVSAPVPVQLAAVPGADELDPGTLLNFARAFSRYILLQIVEESTIQVGTQPVELAPSAHEKSQHHNTRQASDKSDKNTLRERKVSTVRFLAKVQPDGSVSNTSRCKTLREQSLLKSSFLFLTSLNHLEPQ